MLKKIIKLNNIFLITLTMMFSFVTISSVEYSFAQNKNATSLVSCGFGDFNNKCTMANIFDTANKLAGFIIKVIFPTVFFVALGMVLLPLVRDPTNPSVRAEAKSKVKPLLIGAVCVVGAYLVIGVVLRSVGVEKDIIKKAIGYNIIGIEIARAEE
ncbi:MAG: hypothetical protein QM532_02930, partial [Cyanobium sp. MAG06]|nr:hypothetical protein [Cyanobium sp. MAG06]